MDGFDRPIATWATLAVSEGDCVGCTYTGDVEALFDFDGETADWTCPVCKTENQTDVPVGEDPDDARDRAMEWD